MNKDDILYKIKVYEIKSDNIFKHIISRLEKKSYIFSDSFKLNCNLYFKYQKKIQYLKNNLDKI